MCHENQHPSIPLFSGELETKSAVFRILKATAAGWTVVILGWLATPTSTAQQIIATTPDKTVAVAQASDAAPNQSQPLPNGMELEIGIASRIGGPAIGNYQLNNGILSLSNLGRATPQLLTGLGFSCDTSSPTHETGFCASAAKRVGAFVSVQLGAGSNQTITGYSVGATYAISRYLRVLAGFSLTPASEISPGFANAAAQYVSKYAALFPGVNPANLSSGAYGAFDGIQITTTPPGSTSGPSSMIYYPGSVTETRYRGGFLIGIALPINVFTLISGNSKTN